MNVFVCRVCESRLAVVVEVVVAVPAEVEAGEVVCVSSRSSSSSCVRVYVYESRLAVAGEVLAREVEAVEVVRVSEYVRVGCFIRLFNLID